jgi:hypothetical protein
MTDATAGMGPIDYLVMEFAGERLTGESLPLLIDLVDREIIRILDLVFVRRAPDGSVSALTLSEVEVDDDLDLTAFHGAWSGVVDQADIEEAGQVLEPGRVAVLIVYENTWAAPLVGALHRSGAQVVAGGRIPVDVLLGALDAAEAAV